MLNGIDPIIIFQFKKKDDTAAANFQKLFKIPVAKVEERYIDFPPIPIYLSERLTGLYIEGEDKNIDIETSAETVEDGGLPIFYQRGLNSSVKVNLVGKRGSIGLGLIAAAADLIFEKVTSKEYSVTYLHGAITVFNGLINSFSINFNPGTDLYNIGLELTSSTVKTSPTQLVATLPKNPGAIPLG